MQPWRPGLWVAVMAAAAAGFVPLAWLQYRWVGEIGRADKERRETALRASLVRFAQDFDSEIARLRQALFEGRPLDRRLDLEDWEARFAALAGSDFDSRLVKGFYLAHEGKLFQLDRDSLRFRAAEWTAGLEPLRSRLSAVSAAFASGLGPPLPPPDERLPALAVPAVEPTAPPAVRGERPPPARIAGWAIAVLDLDYLKRDLLPRLVRRHFFYDGTSEYLLEVASARDPSQVLYASDPAAQPELFREHDGSIPIFDVPGPLQLRTARGPLRRRAPGPVRQADLEDRRPPQPEGEPRALWRLLVKHRTGSLELAAEQTRRRNLAVSSATLALMALSLALLVVATRRAQKLARLQMEFVAGVSHELRTPLTVICSAADNLADGTVAGDDKVKRYGSVIRSEGRRLGHMLEQILRFSGLHGSRAKYEFRPVAPEEVVGRALSACDPEIRAAGCEVEVAVEPGLPAISADITWLSHALRNLIENALIHGGGKWIAVRAGSGAGRVRFVVEDRGPGIDRAEFKRIFDPFHRGRRAVEDQKRGFGLGLALARRVVEAHSGTLAVESGLGKGARFTIQVPAPQRETNGVKDTAGGG